MMKVHASPDIAPLANARDDLVDALILAHGSLKIAARENSEVFVQYREALKSVNMR